jgi:hypothetical protein
MNRDYVAAQLLASLVSLHMSESEDILIARAVSMTDKLLAKLSETQKSDEPIVPSDDK